MKTPLLTLALWLPLALSAAPSPASCAYDLLAAAVSKAPIQEDPELKAKLWQPLPGMLFLEFDTQAAVTRTFLRLQEHYESPRFRGEVFSLREFVRWYSDSRGGRFTYFTDWAGFNFPSSNLALFDEGRFDPLTKREQRLMDLIAPFRDRPFYLVAGFRQSDFGEAPDYGTLRHETAHALFYLDESYRNEVKAILAKVDSTPIHRYLTAIGYGDTVLEDETHAYLVNDADHLQSSGIDLDPFRETIRELTAAFEGAFARRLSVKAAAH